MYFISIVIFTIILAIILYHSTPNHAVWDDMLNSYPSIMEIKDKLPEYYYHFEKALEHAEVIHKDIISKPMYHTRQSYQQVKDIWQEVMNRWESIAVAPAAVYMQQEVAAGARILQKHALSRLEEIRLYDTSPYRTTWIGQGQPRDPYDSKTVSLV